jgi:hypothetical protein
MLQITEDPGVWHVRQVIDDPAAHHDWSVSADIDLASSDAEGTPVLHEITFTRLD